ncbi:MAG: zinc ribbon domain-containing protein [Coriobacteriales bacterium]|nr:zinc ribbon domain-containing protein [Coriobacteriales bacterium]
MICPNCKKEISDGNLFCRFCGAKIDSSINEQNSQVSSSPNDETVVMPTANTSNAYEQNTVAMPPQSDAAAYDQNTVVMPPQSDAAAYEQNTVVMPPQSDAAGYEQNTSSMPGAQPNNNTANPPQKPSNKKKVIIICVIAAVIVIAATIFFITQCTKPAKDIDITVPISIEDFDDENSSRIPIKIVGSQNDNKSFNEVCFVDSKGVGISLKPGKYSAVFPASPLCKNGNLYKAPENDVYFTIDDKTKAFDTAGEKYTFKKMNPIDITDDDINNAYEYAKKDSGSKKDLDAYKQATIKVRDDAVAAVAEKAKKEAEEKQKADEKSQIDKIRAAVVAYGKANNNDVIVNAAPYMQFSKIHKEGDLLACVIKTENAGQYSLDPAFVVLRIQSDGSYKALVIDGLEGASVEALQSYGFSASVAKQIHDDFLS